MYNFTPIFAWNGTLKSKIKGKVKNSYNNLLVLQLKIQPQAETS